MVATTAQTIRTPHRRSSALVFPTAAVVTLGWRLDLIANNLRDNQVASVRALPQRFAQLEGNRPFVASIAITPVNKG
jgi:hypothetical protein